MVGRGGDIWAERSREEMWGKREREEDELDKGEQGDDRRGGTEVRCYLDTRAVNNCLIKKRILWILHIVLISGVCVTAR